MPTSTSRSVSAAFCFSLLVMLGGCGRAPPARGHLRAALRDPGGSGIIISNGLRTDWLTENALSKDPVANAALTQNALSTATFDPATGTEALRYALHDPAAGMFFRYLVECALSPGQGVEWQDPFDPSAEPLKTEGLAGLCPEWESGPFPVGRACEERVSACILARNNAMGVHVEISVRGEDASAPQRFSLGDTVPVAAWRTYSQQPVESFNACAPGVPGGLASDCGWEASNVGRCAPGSPVRLGAGGQAPDQCGVGSILGGEKGSPRLRVCEGLAGCDSRSGRLLAASDGSCGTRAPAVTFTCPVTGTYSAMVSFPGGPGLGVAMLASERNDFPATEPQVFALREGAFFGTLFDPSALGGVEVRVTEKGKIVRGKLEGPEKAAAYDRMYSCYAPEWTEPLAYAEARLCTLRGAWACAAKSVGPCATRGSEAGVCNTEDGAQVQGDGDFEGCADLEGVVHTEVITTYLNQPCDVVYSQPPDSSAVQGEPLCKRSF